MTQDSPNVAARYTGPAVALHWLIALLIAINLLLIWFADDWPDGWVRPIIDTHKSIGITVLGLVIIRILWRITHAPPPLPASYPLRERRAARVAHVAFYAVMLALPLTGWLHDSAWKDAVTHPMQLFGLVEWPRIAAVTRLDPAVKERLHVQFGAAHAWAGYVLYALFVLHVGGALKHQWLDRHPVLHRMLPRR